MANYFQFTGFNFTTPETIATLTGIDVIAENTLMNVGDTQTLATNGNVTNGAFYRLSVVGAAVSYTSDNETVATVSPEGVVTALKAGTAKITATSTLSGGCTDEITITVIYYRQISLSQIGHGIGYFNPQRRWFDLPPDFQVFRVKRVVFQIKPFTFNFVGRIQLPVNIVEFQHQRAIAVGKSVLRYLRLLRRKVYRFAAKLCFGNGLELMSHAPVEPFGLLPCSVIAITCNGFFVDGLGNRESFSGKQSYILQIQRALGKGGKYIVEFYTVVLIGQKQIFKVKNKIMDKFFVNSPAGTLPIVIAQNNGCTVEPRQFMFA